MPAIRNLNRIWGTSPHAVGIVAGPIAGDDLDAGMRLQPCLDSLGLAVTQKIDWPIIILQIDDDGAVASAATPCPVVDAQLAEAPDLVPVILLAREFRAMVREKQAGKLDQWLIVAQATPLAGFAGGLQRDLAAVRAGLSLPWSTGPVEGQISRLKKIKGTMCGRAGFDLLRHRVLEAA
jgi:hypothetical protein